MITSPLSFAASANCFLFEARRRSSPTSTAHVEPRSRRGRGRDHGAHEGHRRRRHVRLSMRARRADGALRAARDRVDRGLRRGARRRVQGARRSALRARRASSPSIRTSRSRPAKAASSRRTPRRSGSCCGAFGTRAGRTPRRVVQPRAAGLQLPLDRSCRRRWGSRSSRSSTGSWRCAARRRLATPSSWRTSTEWSSPPPTTPTTGGRGSSTSCGSRGGRPRACHGRAARSVGWTRRRVRPCIHLLTYMRELYGFAEGLCPVAEEIASRTMALPFFTGSTPRPGVCPIQPPFAAASPSRRLLA